MTHARRDNPFGILMYHRVAPRVAGVSAPTWNVTPERFQRQLRGLLSHGYQAWPLQRVLACRQAGEPLPPGVFVVTFDDGYDAIYHYAWPILKTLAIPATVFAITSTLDKDEPIVADDWSEAGRTDVPSSTWKPLTSKHCLEMMEQGLMEIGSHTHTHHDFRGQPESFRDDLALSLHVLRDRLGIEQPSFAFPFGYYDDALVAATRAAGLICALTADQHLVTLRSDPFSWGRLAVHGTDTACTLTVKLSRWYTVLRRVWQWLGCPGRASSRFRCHATTNPDLHGRTAVPTDLKHKSRTLILP
jgi:peptidoglycan/xylan/chitin deacetylase (PgdA/CDA1 family)